MTAVSFDVRRGTYYDSVVLMQLQRGLLELPGVQDAGVVMATSANCELLAQSELLPDGIGKVGVEDLLIVVRAESEKEAESALASVDDLLSRRRSVSAGKFQPHSLEGAAEMLPEAEIVLISVPGRYAAEVAREALNLNRHVFLYSDNITLEDEIELKEISGEVGLLVMGPDCGTAIVNGIGLGFANRVRRGGIGLVGASGTGLQAVTSRIHALGGGVSHALGTGGRDLKSEVGGVTAKQALDLLSRDSATEVIVLVSKPPDPEVAASLLNAAQGLSNPVVVHFMGYAAPARSFGNLTFADNFNDAAFVAVDLLKQVS
ncbi:MAG: FdrA family protein, partial [Anaerolineales bacterium]|nr:FdrA family protein [Anaerolineales bacterium]